MNPQMNRASQLRDIERGKEALAAISVYFRREIVQTLAKRMFTENELREVWLILDAYKNATGELADRVYLDALKLSDGSLKKLKELIEAAKRDPREVILPAETPAASTLGFVGYAMLSDDEKDRVTSEDLQQYLSWIENSK